MTNRTDNFNRADSTTTLGTPSDGGSAWSPYSGVWGITSNRGYKETDPANEIAALESSVSAVTVQVTAAGTGAGNGGVMARGADDNNHLIAFWASSGTSFSLDKKVSGSYTVLGNVSGTLSAADVIKLDCTSGDALTAYQNGTSLITATDSAGNTNTQHGLYAFSAGAGSSMLFDDFSITAIVAGDTLMGQACL